MTALTSSPSSSPSSPSGRTTPAEAPRATRSAWLLSRRVDLAVFGGSAALAFVALGVGHLTGDLHDETPGWAWIPAVILCDVAHVWSTALRTYLDPAERRARRALFTVVPAVGLAASVALYALGPLVFWRTLAYLAIFHFVRQQYGWVRLYRARAGERDRLGHLVDAAAIYAATLYPLLEWHVRGPKRFAWFVPGDVVTLGGGDLVMPVATTLWATALAAYAIRALTLWQRGAPNPGKDLVVATTALTWYVGIVAFDSDYAFTVTNVFTHGVPYFALVYVHARARADERGERGERGERDPRADERDERGDDGPGRRGLFGQLTRSVPIYLAALWAIAFVEELLWDRSVWHDRAWLFGEGWEIGSLDLLVVPLLALPQLTHYVLDGFIWRRRSNPSVARFVDGA